MHPKIKEELVRRLLSGREENSITFHPLKLDDAWYIVKNIKSSGEPAQLYSKNTIDRLFKGSNVAYSPFTRRQFHPSNVVKVKDGKKYKSVPKSVYMKPLFSRDVLNKLQRMIIVHPGRSISLDFYDTRDSSYWIDIVLIPVQGWWIQNRVGPS